MSRVLQSMLTVLILPAAAIASAQNMSKAPDPDILVFASGLRKVKIVYTEKGQTLGTCKVRIGKDARVVDQMMCSILANCIAAGWIGIERATKCMNRRVDEVEYAAALGHLPTDSPFPDEWLADGLERREVRLADDITIRGDGAAIAPGNWTFTEMMVGRNAKGLSTPYMLRWQRCVDRATGLAQLLEPPPFTAKLRASLSAECRRWIVTIHEGALDGASACKTAKGASSAASVRGKYSSEEIVVHRVRRWQKTNDWAEAMFDTRGVHQGPCPVLAQTIGKESGR